MKSRRPPQHDVERPLGFRHEDPADQVQRGREREQCQHDRREARRDGDQCYDKRVSAADQDSVLDVRGAPAEECRQGHLAGATVEVDVADVVGMKNGRDEETDRQRGHDVRQVTRSVMT